MAGRVTLILSSLRSGGAEKQLLWIAGELSGLGISCHIVELLAGQRTERIEAMVRLAQAKGVNFLRAPHGSGTLRGLWRLGWHLHEVRPALIWSWGLRADCLCWFARLARYGNRWIVSVRSVNVNMPAIQAWVQRLLARLSDGVVSNTWRGLDLVGANPAVTARHWMLPNALPTDPLPPVSLPATRPQRLVLVMLGNIKVRIKGYDLAAQLIHRLKSAAFPFELRVAGRPDELSELESLFQELDVKPLVRFYGEVSRPEEFLRGGHLYLLLSRFEGMPNTLLEALNCGLPAIATEVGDLRLLKDRGAPYVLIPTEDVAAAVQAVERAVADWPATRAAAAEGREWVQAHFSEDACRAVLRDIVARFVS